MSGPVNNGGDASLQADVVRNAVALPIGSETAVNRSLPATPAVEIERRELADAQSMARIGSWRNDAVAGTTSWSAECYRIFGMPPEEGGASREAFDERVHPDDRQMVMAALDQAAAAHEAYVLDHRLLLPDGTMKWVQGHCEFVYDSAGTVCGSIGTLQDITERKNAEVVLQRSEQLSRMASTLGQIGGWDVDLVTGAIEWSPEVAKIHGTAPDYRPTLDEGIHFYAPESRSLIRDSVTRCINEATPFDVEAQIVNTSGERVWVRVMAEAVANPSGKVIGFRGAIQNITERMRTMQTLRETDQRFRLVALATSDVVWDWDAASNKTWWSDGLQVKFGHVVKPSVDLWAEALHPEDRERVLAGLAASIASGEPWSDEYRFRKGDGSYVRISDRAFSALDENGKVCRMVGAMVDVTEQRMLEARLEQAQRVSTLGQMAANMAHEFNNVLMGIQPFMEVLRRLTADIPKAQNATARIAESVQRGKQITDEILRYAREAEPVANPIRIRDWFAGYSAKNVGAGSPSPAVPAAEPAVPPVRSRAKTVLIIDDESTVADGICMLLASEAVHAHAIQTGEEAIGAIERHAPDVVMLDIGLPDISGVEVFHRIHGRWADLRVVLMTGHYGRGDLDSILVLPHVRFLQKPFGIEELLEVLQW